jgi:hypothetical protein
VLSENAPVLAGVGMPRKARHSEAAEDELLMPCRSTNHLCFSLFSGIVVGQEIRLRRLPQESLVALRDVKRTPPLVLRIQQESAPCKKRYSVMDCPSQPKTRRMHSRLVSNLPKDHPMIKPATYGGPKHPAHDPTIIPVKTRVNRKRRSPYRDLLERLLDSPKNSVLRVKNVNARLSIRKHAHALGYEAVFAEHEGWLYVKLAGVLNDERRRTKPVVKGAQKSVLDALANTPKTAAEVSRILKSDSASCEVILSHLVKAGIVERDDGLGNRAIYRALSSAKRGD